MRKHRQYIVRSLKMYLRCFFGKFTEDTMLRKLNNYFTTFEKILWIGSLVLITGSAVMFGKDGILSVIASLIGATSLLLNAKGNPIGQALGVIFSILYAIISYSFAYYGEMITYLGLTGPMALAAFISWIRNPFAKGKAEVKVNHIHRGEVLFMFILAAVVTVVFYFVLDFFNTANLIPSTVSVTTSFLAVYLTFRRNRFFAVAYAANDIVLIILWSLAALTDISYISVVVCFVIFFVNDIYGFVSWSAMRRRQAAEIQP